MNNTQLPVDIIHWIAALLPIAVLMFLLVGLRWKGIEAGPLGMLAAGLMALLVFRTPLSALAVAGG
jgi:lactate permease